MHPKQTLNSLLVAMAMAMWTLFLYSQAIGALISCLESHSYKTPTKLSYMKDFPLFTLTFCMTSAVECCPDLVSESFDI